MNIYKKLILISVLIPFCILLTQCKKDKINDQSDNQYNLNEDTGKLELFRAVQMEKNKDISNSTVNYFDIKKIDNSKLQETEDDSPFTIVDKGPVGELSSTVHNPTIFVIFSQPVVPISKLGEVMTKSDIMRIEPEIKGVFRWYGTKLLSFEPETYFTPQNLYKVIIDRKVSSLGGKKLEGENEFTFFTEFLNIQNYSPTGGDVPLESAKNITVTFKYPVNLELIKNYLEIKSNNKSYNFKISRPKKENNITDEYISKTVLLTVNSVFEENSNVDIILKEGAKSEEGYIGIPKNIIRSFNTLKPFSFSYYNTNSYTFKKSNEPDANPLYLYFSHPLKKESVKNNIISSLPISDPDNQIEIYGNTIKINNLPVKYNSSYSVTIKPGIEDIYGRKLTEQNIIDVKVGEAMRYSYFPNQDIKILESQFESKIAYEYQNTFGGMWKIDKISKPYGDPFSNQELYPYDFKDLQRDVKRIEVLDLSKWLNEGKKGYVGMSWNFDRRELPREIKYNEFDKIKQNISDSQVSRIMEDIYFTNNQKAYYYLDRKWDLRDKREIALSYFEENDINFLKLTDHGRKSLMLQVTDLAVTTRYGYNEVIVMVASLSTGNPVGGAEVTLVDNYDYKERKTGVTDDKGISVIPLSKGDVNLFHTKRGGVSNPIVRVVKDNDKVEYLLNNSHNAYHFGIYEYNSPWIAIQKRWHQLIFSDRGLYKPGETVTFRGIDRQMELGKYSPYKGEYTITVNNMGYNEKPIFTEKGTTTESGGFFGTFQLPEDIKPGYYYIQYFVDMYHNSSISFQVANFRKLSFQAKIIKPDITYYKNDMISLKLKADYLSGGALNGAGFESYWTKEMLYFKPEGDNWKQYRFGPDKYSSRETLSGESGKLNNLGEFELKQDISGNNDDGITYKYNVSARIEDIDRQVINASESVVVHPASFYIGAKFSGGKEGWWSPFVKKNQSQTVEFILVDTKGDIYSGIDKNKKLDVRLYTNEWKIAQQEGVYDEINTRYEMVEAVEYEQKISLNDFKGSFSIKPEKCGEYILELSSTDNFGRKVLTNLRFYSTGSEWIMWGGEKANDITLLTDKNIYEPGESVKLLVQSPLQKGRYLLTIEREGIFEEKVIDLEGSANQIEIPVKEEYLPVFYVSIASYSVRSGVPPKNYLDPDLGKPKGYFGIIPVRVSTKPVEIVLEVKPTKNSYLPGTDAEFTITAKKNGKPLPDTEITFLASDRGVLDLINYHIPDPVDFFYSSSKFPLGVVGGDSRSLLIDPVTYDTKDLHGGDGDEKMKKRKDFSPMAFFAPYLKTDGKGEVKVKFKLPDSLTTYRCTALAVKENFFGIKENEIMAQNPINVRTALPRKMRIRDTAIAGVIVTNLDSESHKITIEVTSDLLTIDGDMKKEIELLPKARVEVPFKLVALKAGESTVVFTTRSDILNEQLEENFIVEQPIIKEVFTTIGSTKIDENDPNKTFAQEGLLIPSNIGQGYGGVTISLDSTKLTTLSESIQYLFYYPYGCLEQRSSKMFPLVIFGDLVKPFLNINNPKEVVEKELIYWANFQNSDGGFPYWLEGGYPSGKFISIKIAKFLYYAKENNIKIPSSINIGKLLDYIAIEEKNMDNYLKLYSLYAQALHGRNVLVKANDIYDRNDALKPSEYAFLGLIYYFNKDIGMAKKMRNKIKNYIKVGTRSIDIVGVSNRYYFNSEINDYALILMLYHLLNDKEEVYDLLVRTLISRQRRGYWENTVSTEWALQAFRYVYEDESGTSTNFKSDVIIDDKNIMNNKFKGAVSQLTTKFLGFEDELKDFKRDELLPLQFKTEGKGTLYYTASIKYSLPTEVALPRDEGFGVFTEMYDLNGNKVSGREALKLGETYKMRIIISTTKRRQYVAIRVPIPSGAEVLDSSFVTTAKYEDKNNNNNDYDYYYWWYRPVQFIYDNEVQYFYNDMYEGKKEMEFIFRVTTPGIYPTPPAMAECMYEDEVFGRNGGDLFLIKP